MSVWDRDYSHFTVRERIAFLKEAYWRVHNVLDSFCTGYLSISDDPLNAYYVKLCLLVEKLVHTDDLEDLASGYARPLPTLYDIEDANTYWKDYAQFRSLSFVGTITERHIQSGEPPCVDMALIQFMQEVDSYIAFYAAKKKREERAFVEKVKRVAQESAPQAPSEAHESPKTDRLGFIK